MATQPSEKQGKSNHAEQPADVRVSVGSAPSQSRGAPEISEEEVDGHYAPFAQFIKRLFKQESASKTAKITSGSATETWEEEVERYYYQPLLQAAFKGDWEFAKRFFERDADSKTAKITSKSETVLHIAALSAQDQFLENLVELLSLYPDALEVVDCDGRTALHNAVLCGRIRMVKALVRSNPKLTQLQDNEKRVPLGISALEASMHKEIAWFLAKNTTDDGPSHPFSSPSAIDFIIDLTFAGHHDIVLYLVGRYPHLITMKKENDSILKVLARMESHFPSGTRLSVLEAFIYKCIPVDLNYKTTDENSRNMQTSMDPVLQCLTRLLCNAAKILVPTIKRIHEVKMRHVAAIKLAKQICIALSSTKIAELTEFFQEGDILGEATARGISELVKLCTQFFPELIWISSHGEKLMTIAVRYRQERTLRLFLKVSSANELSLVPGPTLLESMKMMFEAAKYAAAEYNPNFDAVTNVAGAAFQMQRELQWYKAVEGCILPRTKAAYFGRKTFWNVFVEQHEKLLENGEKWAKDTANSCMLVSTLIATVLFAAAFTMPGGNDDKTGVPLLIGHDTLLVFAISDALGLYSSVTAILLFLAILTSRYEAQDFLESLPKKIITGLSLLFLSLAFMLVAFTAALTIVLDKRLEWVFIPITLLASLPVALFARLQLPLLFQMVKSTYGPSIFRPESIWERGIIIGRDRVIDDFDLRV